MTATATSSNPDPQDAGVQSRAVIERQLATLGRLAEVGLNIALAIERQALAAQDAAPQAGLESVALAYGRVSRAVRLTIGLQARLLGDLQAVDDLIKRHAAGAAQRAREAHAKLAAQAARKGEVKRIVDRVIEASVAEEARADRLAETAYERLDQDDIDGVLASKPVGEIVALICQELGLSPDWTEFAQEAWARDVPPDDEPPPTRRVVYRWLDAPMAEAAPTEPPDLAAASP